MTPAAAPRGRTSPTGHLSIGQVLARLSPEFPALSASKLRYLEVQGIVSPVRTESGYRKFSATDVERLRTTLTMQRDYGIPLARIREYLDDPAGDSASMPASIVQTARRHRRDELIAAAGASPVLLSDAVTAGLIPAGDTFDDRALAMLRALVALEGHGIQPRHLRSLRQAAERDVTLVESALAPLLRKSDATARAKAHELAPELLRRIDELRAGLIQTALERMTP